MEIFMEMKNAIKSEVIKSKNDLIDVFKEKNLDKYIQIRERDLINLEKSVEMFQHVEDMEAVFILAKEANDDVREENKDIISQYQREAFYFDQYFWTYEAQRLKEVFLKVKSKSEKCFNLIVDEANDGYTDEEIKALIPKLRDNLKDFLDGKINEQKFIEFISINVLQPMRRN